MKKLIFEKHFRKLNITEQKAYRYLTAKGIKINILDKRRYGIPDFKTLDGEFYEIKKALFGHRKNINYHINFTRHQIERFKDSDNILIFFPFEDKPRFETTFGEIKKYIAPSRILSISKLENISQINTNHNQEKRILRRTIGEKG